MKGNLKRKYNYFTIVLCLDVSIFSTYSLRRGTSYWTSIFHPSVCFTWLLCSLNQWVYIKNSTVLDTMLSDDKGLADMILISNPNQERGYIATNLSINDESCSAQGYESIGGFEWFEITKVQIWFESYSYVLVKC